MNSDPDNRELLELADLAVEGRITEPQMQRLESLVRSNANHATTYAHYISLHASLRITSTHTVALSSNARLADGVSSVEPSPTNRWWWLAIAATFLIAMSGLYLVGSFLSRNELVPIATIVETKNCKWGSGTLPTGEGAKLGPGTLRLSEGLATIVFKNGVELKLESPADIELVTSMKCVMRSGQVIAKVPPQAHGFVVETNSSIVTDLGTEFGVSVGQDGAAVVQVFDGRVDAFHRKLKTTSAIFAGDKVRFDESSFRPHTSAEQSIQQNETQPSNSDTPWIQITTAQGKGQDGYIQSGAVDIPSRSLLLVKRPIATCSLWERRAYLGFDLAELRGRRVVQGELRLTTAPSGIGFASLIADARFRVYGLIDESEDGWSEDTLSWDTAPATGPSRQLPDMNKVLPLGSFLIERGEPSSTIVLDSEEMVHFLNSDTNGIATIIVVRETEGSSGSDLVHAFSSRRHESLPPPSLRLHVESTETNR